MQMETNRIEDSNIRQMFITIVSTHQFSSKSITNCLYIWHTYNLLLTIKLAYEGNLPSLGFWLPILSIIIV